MQALGAQAIGHDLGLFTKNNAIFVSQLTEFNTWQVPLNSNESFKNKIPILICDPLIYDHPEMAIKISQAVQKGLIKKTLLLTVDVNETVPIEIFNLLGPSLVLAVKDFNKDAILALYEQIQTEEQDLAYLDLSKELNQEYESIKKQLEEQLDEKTNNLLESRRKIFEINNRTEFLRKILFVISEVHDPDLIEPKLNELLTQANKVTWIKVVNDNDRNAFEKVIEENFDSTVHRTQLVINTRIIHIFFFKGDKKPFKKTDLELYQKLNEMLQTSLDRFSHLRELQKSESLYQLAFSSTRNPILILNREHHVIQSNVVNPEKLPCYQLLFQRDKPCLSCHFGERFQIESGGNAFQVDSNLIQNDDLETEQHFVHVYEDVTERNHLEKKIMQTSRLAELGIIASSIAHELNNPLGGIISYLQLMKLDLPKEHVFQQDIQMMFEATQRMKKIIDDLLVFSRKSDATQKELVNLPELVKLISDSLSLQWAQENIKVIIPSEENFQKIVLAKNTMKEAIDLIFKFFIQKHKDRKKEKSNQISMVEVKFFQDQMNTSLSFLTNLFIKSNENSTKELSLLILEKILADQYYQLVIDYPDKDWTRFKIKLSSRFH